MELFLICSGIAFIFSLYWLVTYPDELLEVVTFQRFGDSVYDAVMTSLTVAYVAAGLAFPFALISVLAGG